MHIWQKYQNKRHGVTHSFDMGLVRVQRLNEYMNCIINCPQRKRNASIVVNSIVNEYSETEMKWNGKKAGFFLFSKGYHFHNCSNAICAVKVFNRRHLVSIAFTRYSAFALPVSVLIPKMLLTEVACDLWFVREP